MSREADSRLQRPDDRKHDDRHQEHDDCERDAGLDIVDETTAAGAHDENVRGMGGQAGETGRVRCE